MNLRREPSTQRVAGMRGTVEHLKKRADVDRRAMPRSVVDGGPRDTAGMAEPRARDTVRDGGPSRRVPPQASGCWWAE